MAVQRGHVTFLEAFRKAAGESDRLEIAVGYVSKSALLELDAMVHEIGIRSVILNMGMYYQEGIAEGTYHAAVDVNRRWQSEGMGGILLVRPFKYHGKLYVFYRDGKPFRAFVGSHNLGAIKPEASNLRQYEISAETDDRDEVREIADFVEELSKDIYSVNIGDVDISQIKLIRETNTSLSGVELVSEIPPKSVELYQRQRVGNLFRLPLKVPKAADIAYDLAHGTHTAKYTKSNINVCYAAPRSARKNRSWFETQLTVSNEIRNKPGYPEKNEPFYVVTDDGYWFKAHTTSDNNKQFSAVGDELIMGRWLKGRLAAAGLVQPVNDTGKDTERRGMITDETLKAYGADCLVFSKTKLMAMDEAGNNLPVWTLSFLSEQSTAGMEIDSMESESGDVLPLNGNTPFQDDTEEVQEVIQQAAEEDDEA